ncbi:unnamed protein product, partial [Discosporangium mesarthrocarpum]
LKKILLLIFLKILLMETVMSQSEWAPIGAKWIIEERFAFSPSINFIEIRVIGDTIINNQNCKILERTRQSCNARPLREYMYEEDQKVYFYDERNAAFNLLFDFGVDRDSSWKMIRVNPYEYEELEEIEIRVDSISYKITERGDSIKVQNISFESEVYPYRTELVFDKIGFNTGLFPFRFELCDGNFENEMRCYEDANFGKVTFVEIDCQFVEAPDMIRNEKQKVRLNPNPVLNKLTVNNQGGDFLEITIVDLNGRILLVDSIFGEEREINVTNLQNGLYFLRAIDNDNRIQIQRFVKY